MFKGILAATLAIAAVPGYAYWFHDQRIHVRVPLSMSIVASITEDKAEQMAAQFRRDERQALDSIHALGSSPASLPNEARKVVRERLGAIEGQRQEIAEAERAKQLTPASAEKLRSQLQLEASYLHTLSKGYKPKW